MKDQELKRLEVQLRITNGRLLALKANKEFQRLKRKESQLSRRQWLLRHQLSARKVFLCKHPTQRIEIYVVEGTFCLICNFCKARSSSYFDPSELACTFQEFTGRKFRPCKSLGGK